LTDVYVGYRFADAQSFKPDAAEDEPDEVTATPATDNAP
jgi:hypothetical protein